MSPRWTVTPSRKRVGRGIYWVPHQGISETKAYTAAMNPAIVIIDEPTEEDRLAVLEPLSEFNNAQAGPVNMRPVAIMLKDASGKSIGGLWGHTGLRLDVRSVSRGPRSMPGSRPRHEPYAACRAACPNSRVHRRLARYLLISGTRILQKTRILSVWRHRGSPRWTSTDFPKQALLTRSAAQHPSRRQTT